MTTNEIDELLQTPEAQEEIERRVQRAADRRVTQAVKTYQENHPEPNTDEHDRKIEDQDREIRELRIEKQVLIECQRQNIDRNLIESFGISFTDEADVTSRLEEIGAALEAKRVADMNTHMLATSYVPSSGISDDDRPNLNNMSRDQAIILEEMNQLDDLIKQ